MTCNYPGCTRPVIRGSGPGRPAEYCDLPEHTRWRAWRERQRLAQAVEGEQEVVTVTKGPQGITAGKIRAEELLERFRVLAEQLSTTLTGAVTELSAIADPSVLAWSVTVWLWLTVVFANLAEAVASSDPRPGVLAGWPHTRRGACRSAGRRPGRPKNTA